jgi:hypothetical protein
MHTTEFSVSELPPGLRKLFFLWTAAKKMDGFGCMESTQLFPAALQLDRLIYTEVFTDAAGAAVDFQFVYIGAAHDKAMTSPVNGAHLTQLDGKGPGSQIWAAYVAAYQCLRPLFVSLPYIGTTESCAFTQELFVPFKDHRNGTHYIVTGVSLVDPPARLLTRLRA